MQFSRQEYWKGLPLPTPGDLPNPGIEPTSLVSPALAGEIFTTSSTWPITWHIILAQEMKLINIINSRVSWYQESQLGINYSKKQSHGKV